MKQYRFKHTVEAVQWDGTEECLDIVCDCLGIFNFNPSKYYFGNQTAAIGDFVCKSESGEEFLIDSCDFERDYELIADCDDLRGFTVDNQSTSSLNINIVGKHITITDADHGHRRN